jgi:peptidoglycan hydrolase-like protein with peptidoglycan-binding domain
MKRLSVAVGTVLVVVVVAAIAWIVGRSSAAPEEVNLPDPPSPSILAVPVEIRRLEKTIVTRGTVDFAATDSIPLGRMDVVGEGVVTRSEARNHLLAEGDIALEVDGRPIILLQGNRPSFRSLNLGAAGVDVVQLQDALVRLGHGVRVDGTFGPSTADAVIELLVSRGYPPALVDDIPVSRAAHISQLWLDAGNDSACAAPMEPEACPYFEELVDQYTLSRVDVWVPYGEILFVDELPRVLGSPTPNTGDSVDSVTLNLATRDVRVASLVPVADAQLLKLGMNATADEEATRTEASGRIIDIRTEDEQGSLGSSALILVELDENAEALVGRSVRVQIPIVSTGGEVPVVPVGALRTDTGGNSWVQLLNDDESTSWLQIHPGIEADGFVEIRPIDGVIPSDAFVVIGEEDPP